MGLVKFIEVGENCGICFAAFFHRLWRPISFEQAAVSFIRNCGRDLAKKNYLRGCSMHLILLKFSFEGAKCSTTRFTLGSFPYTTPLAAIT